MDVSIIKNRNFMILFGGQLISIFGNNLYYIALPWFVYSFTNSKVDLVYSGLATSLPNIAGLFVGVLVDRWRKKATMVWSDVCRMLLAATLFIVSSNRINFFILLFIVVLFELIGTLFSPAESAFLPMVVKPDQIPLATGWNQSGTALAALFGKFAGGSFLVFFGAPALFVVNSASFLLSVISLLFVRVSEPVRNRDGDFTFFKEWITGIAVILKSKFLLRVVLSGFVSNFGMSSLMITLTTWIRNTIHGTAFTFGLVSSVFLAGSMFGGLLFGKLATRLRVTVALKVGLLLLGASVGLIGVLRSPYWTMGCMGLAGLCVAILNSSIGTLMIQHTPENLRGRVFGSFGSLMILTAPLGMILFGILLHQGVQLTWMFALMGSFCVLAGLSHFVKLKDDLLTEREGEQVSQIH